MKTTAMETPETRQTATYSGGPISEAHQRQYVALRNLVQKEPDVVQVLELSRLPDGQWMYLIQTPFVTFPKFVIGRTNVENQHVVVVFRCGSEWAARAEWDRAGYGMEVDQ
jgi:hypothetical protein